MVFNHDFFCSTFCHADAHLVDSFERVKVECANHICSSDKLVSYFLIVFINQYTVVSRGPMLEGRVVVRYDNGSAMPQLL